MQKKRELVSTEFNAGWLSKAESDHLKDDKVTLEEARKLCEFAHIGHTTAPYDGTGRFDMSMVDVKASPKDLAALTTSEAWHNASDSLVESWLKARKEVDPKDIDKEMIAKTRETYEMHFAKKETEKALSL